MLQHDSNKQRHPVRINKKKTLLLYYTLGIYCTILLEFQLLASLKMLASWIFVELWNIAFKVNL